MVEPVDPKAKPIVASVTPVSAAAAKAENVALRPCLEKDAEDSSEIKAQYGGRQIYLAGPHDSGKTGIIGGLYLKFKQGPFDNFSFARSQTLHGFERKAHPLTAASNREEPKPVRSENVEELYFHLGLKEKKTGQVHDLFISDIKGEELDDLTDNKEVAAKHSCIAACDHFVLTIDGEKYKDPRQKVVVIDTACGLVRRLLDEKLLSRSAHLQVVLTKLDLIAGTEKPSAETVKLRAALASAFARFGSDVASLEVFLVSACPKTNMESFKMGADLIRLLNVWFERERHGNFEIDLAGASGEPVSEYQRFQTVAESEGI